MIHGIQDPHRGIPPGHGSFWELPDLPDQVHVFRHLGKPEGYRFPGGLVLPTGVTEGSDRVAEVIEEIRGDVQGLLPPLDDFAGPRGVLPHEGRQIEHVGIHHHPKPLPLRVVVLADFLEAEHRPAAHGFRVVSRVRTVLGWKTLPFWF